MSHRGARLTDAFSERVYNESFPRHHVSLLVVPSPGVSQIWNVHATGNGRFFLIGSSGKLLYVRNGMVELQQDRDQRESWNIYKAPTSQASTSKYYITKENAELEDRHGALGMYPCLKSLVSNGTSGMQQSCAWQQWTITTPSGLPPCLCDHQNHNDSCTDFRKLQAEADKATAHTSNTSDQRICEENVFITNAAHGVRLVWDLNNTFLASPGKTGIGAVWKLKLSSAYPSWPAQHHFISSNHGMRLENRKNVIGLNTDKGTFQSWLIETDFTSADQDWSMRKYYFINHHLKQSKWIEVGTNGRLIAASLSLMKRSQSAWFITTPSGKPPCLPEALAYVTEGEKKCIYPTRIAGPGCPGLKKRPAIRNEAECAAACCADSTCVAWQWRPRVGRHDGGDCSTGIPLGRCADDGELAPDFDISDNLRPMSVTGGMRRVSSDEGIFCTTEPKLEESLTYVAATLNDLMSKGKSCPYHAVSFWGGVYVVPPKYRLPNGCQFPAEAGMLSSNLETCLWATYGPTKILPSLDEEGSVKRVISPFVASLCAIDFQRYLIEWVKRHSDLRMTTATKFRGEPSEISAVSTGQVQALVIADAASFAEGAPILRAMGLEPHRSPPVSPDTFKLNGFNCSKHLHQIDEWIPPNELRNAKANACFAAHRNALNLAAKYNGHSLILERDWTIGNQMPSSVGARVVAAAREGSKLTLFGHCYGGLCAHAYLVSSEQAHRMLAPAYHPCSFILPVDYLTAIQCSNLFTACTLVEGSKKDTDPSMFGDGIIFQNRTKFVDQMHTSSQLYGGTTNKSIAAEISALEAALPSFNATDALLSTLVYTVQDLGVEFRKIRENIDHLGKRANNANHRPKNSVIVAMRSTLKAKKYNLIHSIEDALLTAVRSLQSNTVTVLQPDCLAIGEEDADRCLHTHKEVQETSSRGDKVMETLLTSYIHEKRLKASP